MPHVEGWPPAWVTPVSEEEKARGDGDRVSQFTDTFCTITKDSIAGKAGSKLILRPWQEELNRCLWARRADGRLKHRQGLIGLPRKNGKSSVLSAINLYGLLFGPHGGEVYAVASSRDQARIVFNTTKRMVELNPELSRALILFKDAIEDKSTGSVMRVLAAEAPQLEGLNPSLVCYDELHTAPNRELWDVLSLASGARSEPLMVGITTAGVKYDPRGQDSFCYSLWQHGIQVALGEIDDPSFFMAWWGEKDMEADYKDPEVWARANPGYGDLIDPEEFVSSSTKTPEMEFRTKRLNMWVERAQAWLPTGAWDKVEDKRPIPDGADVVLAFDGSFKGDSTALIAVQLGDVPHIDVAGHWERPRNAPPDWHVPILVVEDAIREACLRWNVVEIAADPYRWSRSLELLGEERLPVEQFPQSPSRMSPATTRFYEAVVQGQITQSGNPALARHVGSAVMKMDSRGTRIVKETKDSQRKIDLAVAAVMGLDRAAWWSQNRTKPRRVVSF